MPAVPAHQHQDRDAIHPPTKQDRSRGHIALDTVVMVPMTEAQYEAAVEALADLLASHLFTVRQQRSQP